MPVGTPEVGDAESGAVPPLLLPPPLLPAAAAASCSALAAAAVAARLVSLGIAGGDEVTSGTWPGGSAGRSVEYATQSLLLFLRGGRAEAHRGGRAVR